MEVKWQGCKADHSPETTAEVKKTWICTPTPHMPSWSDAKLALGLHLIVVPKANSVLHQQPVHQQIFQSVDHILSK
jgi:hypothetical protein